MQPFILTLPGSVVKVEMEAIPADSIRIGERAVAIKPFWIARTETTWEAYDAFTSSGPPSPAYDQWKLYDMLGNVGEWAIDADGKPVLCGGAYNDKAARVYPGARARQTPAWQATDPQLPKSRWWLSDGSFVGFRIVCEP